MCDYKAIAFLYWSIQTESRFVHSPCKTLVRQG